MTTVLAISLSVFALVLSGWAWLSTPAGNPPPLYSVPDAGGKSGAYREALRAIRRHKQILAKIGELMSLADEIEAAVAKINEAVAENNASFAALKGSVATLNAQVNALQSQVVTLSAAGNQPDPELVAAVDELKIAADAAAAQADAIGEVPPVEVPSVAVESDTPAAVVADGGLIDASITPETETATPAPVPADEPVAETPEEPAVLVPVDPAADPVQAGDLAPDTLVAEVPAVSPVEIPEGATAIAAGELPPDATVTPVE